jgi:hypothetical protein
VLDKPISQVGRQAVDLRHLPEAAGRDMSLKVHIMRKTDGPCHGERIEQFVGIKALQTDETERGGAGWAIVPLQQTAQLIDSGAELMELQREEPPVRAQLNNIGVQLVLEPPHHLQPLRNKRKVSDRYLVLDFQGG